ncbi:MAG: glycosyltransferase, partial [Bacteroidetes bacterium]|nr:glycosyltransferase [Bacteroidota bacterium]
TVFIYGGNLGKPQGIGFLNDIIFSNRDNLDIFFLIVGSGTEFYKIQRFLEENAIKNAKLIKSLSKQEYDNLVYSSDVGLIFLDPRFTIPNFPSRLLSYLENKKPVVAATDNTTDLGFILEKNGAGYWVENGDLEKMNNILSNFVNNKEKIESMGKRGYELLRNNYSVEISYDIIMSHFS